MGSLFINFQMMYKSLFFLKMTRMTDFVLHGHKHDSKSQLFY